MQRSLGWVWSKFLPLATIWSFSFFFIKVGDSSFAALQVAAGRILLGAAVLVVLLFARRESFPPRVGLVGQVRRGGHPGIRPPLLPLRLGRGARLGCAGRHLERHHPLMVAIVASLGLADDRMSAVRVAGLATGLAGVLVVLDASQRVRESYLSCSTAALAAGVLAREAHVAPSTASEHLGRLVQAGILTAEQWGRRRYYRIAGPEVASAIEALQRLAPVAPVSALREAHTCYDHIAGRLGVAVMAALLQNRLITGGDGRFHPDTAVADRLSGRGRDVDYRLTAEGEARLRAFGIEPSSGGGLLTVRYCIDWSEQRHHLAGGVGAALLRRLFALDWVRRSPRSRALIVTPAGEQGLAAVFGVRGWRDGVPATAPSGPASPQPSPIRSAPA